MKINEFEKKRMIEKTEYDFLCACVGNGEATELQINYYYDTEDEYFRRNNITCRIRQKDRRLVGTVKRHGVGGQNQHSSEERFKVNNLPHSFEVDARKVYLKGLLITQRLEVELCSKLCLVLDKNSYLGEIDYEIEIEYQEGCEQMVEGVMVLMEKMLYTEEGKNKVLSKSERFFRRLSSLPGQAQSKSKGQGSDPDAYMQREVLTNKGEQHGRT